MARAHVASLADLVGAARLPEGIMHATAGTEVVVDVLVFQRRSEDQAPSGPANLVEIAVDGGDAEAGDEAEDDPSLPNALSAPPDLDNTERRHQRRGVVQINEYFAAHPEMVLGTHAQRRGIYGPGLC